MTALPPPTGSDVSVVATARKALVAATFGAAGALGVAMLDGNLTTTEGIVALGTGLVAGVGTYQVRNADDG